MHSIEIKIDPRTKLIIALCLTSMAVIVQDLGLRFVLVFISWFFSIYFQSNLSSLLKKGKTFLRIFLALMVIQSIFSPSGKVLLQLGDFEIITTGGLLKGLRFLTLMTIIIIAANIMITVNNREMIQGLIQFKIPYELAFMVSIAIRFLPMFADEIKQILMAIQLRGIEINKISLFKKVKIFLYIFLPLIAGMILKAQRLSMAMETRAFRAYPKRTSFYVLEMKKNDYCLIGIMSILTLSILTIYFI